MNPQPARQCSFCPHDLDPHEIYILDMTRGYGICLCPVPRCTCGSTIRISTTGPSTPDQIAETRTAVLQILTNAGLPLPTFLQ